ncbi:hypothetical protein JCM10207_006911 [Rhodosporidiobolus poonsookiae]
MSGIKTYTHYVCYVCDEETTQRCSRCHDLYVCSPECFKLVWPVHSWLCKSPRQALFTCPPLSATEVDAINMVYETDVQLRPAGPDKPLDTLTYLEKLNLGPVDWETLRVELSSPDPSLPEPTRTAYLLASHRTLHDILTSPSFASLPPSSPIAQRFAAFDTPPTPSPWQVLSKYAYPLLTLSKGGTRARDIPSAPEGQVDLPRVLQTCKPLFEQLLLMQQLVYLGQTGQGWRVKELEIAVWRTEAAFGALPLEGGFRANVREVMRLYEGLVRQVKEGRVEGTVVR